MSLGVITALCAFVVGACGTERAPGATLEDLFEDEIAVIDLTHAVSADAPLLARARQEPLSARHLERPRRRVTIDGSLLRP